MRPGFCVNIIRYHFGNFSTRIIHLKLQLTNFVAFRQILPFVSYKHPQSKVFCVYLQLFIQSSNGSGLGPSQVLKVTSRGGKAVTTEDITKIVSSLPNLKSGSRIIVNTAPTSMVDSKVTCPTDLWISVLLFVPNISQRLWFHSDVSPWNYEF